jgi:hypothetical protein
MTTIIQYDDKKIPAYLTCIEQVKAALPKSVTHLLFDKTNIEANCEDYRAVSNIFRCIMAMHVKDMVWLDTDVLVNKWPDFRFNAGKVYFATGNSGQPENWAFFVNGRCDFFQRMYDKFIKDTPKNIWWFAEFVRANRSEIELVPEGYFTHLMMSRAVNAGEYFHNAGNNQYNISRGADSQLSVELRN